MFLSHQTISESQKMSSKRTAYAPIIAFYPQYYACSKDGKKIVANNMTCISTLNSWKYKITYLRYRMATRRHHGSLWKADTEERTNYCWSKETLAEWSGVSGHQCLFHLTSLTNTHKFSVGCVYKLNPVQVWVWKNNKRILIIYEKTVTSNHPR